jgi:hypothetical protein
MGLGRKKIFFKILSQKFKLQAGLDLKGRQPSVFYPV